MCGGHSSASVFDTSASNNTTETLTAAPLPDGYWVQSFNFTTNAESPDIIAYGLGFLGAPAVIRLFTNPKNDSEARQAGWKSSEIASLDFPVGMTVADLTGDGFNDVIISDRYGPSMDNLWDAKTQDGGRIQWLRNPGKRIGQPYWEPHKIGNSTGMHRLQAGHFTRSDVIQIMALPIISKSGDFTSPAPIIIFTPSYGVDKSKGPISWKESIAFADRFRMIHDVKLLPRSNGSLDMVVVSGQEGIVLLWYDADNEEWKFNVIGEGLPAPSGAPYFDDKFWGCGGVDICRVGDDDVGYIATVEAFHGYIVAVYTKSSKAPKGPASLKDSSYWTRHVIDDYGPLENKKRATGPLHHAAAVPLPNSATEAFAVACMGVPSGDKLKQGVYLYEPVDLKEAKFKKVRVTSESAGRLAVADYSVKKRMDIASLSYYVPGYFTGPDPPSLRINTVGNRESQFSAAKLDNEVLLRIPRPSLLPLDATPSLPFWAIAGKILALFVIPPNQRRVLEDKIVAIKLIYGEVKVSESNGPYSSTRTIAPPAKKAETTLVPRAAVINAGKDGAVFVAVAVNGNSFQGPFTSMSQITSTSAMPQTDNIPPEVASLTFPFNRVDTLPWGKEGGLWNDFEFYNAFGFHIYFNDDWMDRIVHMQAWTLGIGETARFHVHSGTGRSFCEIHYCLNNGGGGAGMRYFADDSTETQETIQKNELTKKYVEEHSTLIVVPDLEEHGPLWKIQQGTKATPQLLPNGAVAYPWHAWLASDFGDYKLPIKPPLKADKQRFDVWLAFEFPLSLFQF